MKNSKLPSLVVLMILTVITVVFWIAFSVYRSFSSSPAPAVGTSITAPIVPTLDNQTVEKMKNRIYP